VSFELTAILEPVEDGWVQARIAEIPGVITAGADEAEARDLLVDALREYMLALGELGEDVVRPPNGEHYSLAVTLTL